MLSSVAGSAVVWISSCTSDSITVLIAILAHSCTNTKILRQKRLLDVLVKNGDTF